MSPKLLDDVKKMSHRTICFTPAQEAYIHQLLKAGLYNNFNEAVRHMILYHMERQTGTNYDRVTEMIRAQIDAELRNHEEACHTEEAGK